jgi:hypothetical protein
MIDTATAAVTRHASSFQGYTLSGYEEILNACGFDEVSFYPELGAEDLNTPMNDFFALTAIKA